MGREAPVPSRDLPEVVVRRIGMVVASMAGAASLALSSSGQAAAANGVLTIVPTSYQNPSGCYNAQLNPLIVTDRTDRTATVHSRPDCQVRDRHGPAGWGKRHVRVRCERVHPLTPTVAGRRSAAGARCRARTGGRGKRAGWGDDRPRETAGPLGGVPVAAERPYGPREGHVTSAVAPGAQGRCGRTAVHQGTPVTRDRRPPGPPGPRRRAPHRARWTVAPAWPAAAA